MDQAVIPFDWARMLLGDAPPSFLFEILFRTVVIYIYTFGLIRWIGGRSISQLSLVEFLLVIALGSAVGDTLFYPDVPLLHAMLVITVIVLINKGLDFLILRSDTAQKVIDGKPDWILQDGRLNTEQSSDRGMGKAEVLAMLRLEGIRNLGEVENAFLEASGSLSVFRTSKPIAGMPIVPPHEICPLPRVDPTSQDGGSGSLCCMDCALLRTGSEISCQNCGGEDWTPATIADAKSS
ncbi:putative membrane protein [Hoeflea sp. IMCC20628]|uniref:DUF421 domain-containing protein n=1 Tax=Hoeflea sp. IMCC20628 TaxID=1620421 RepID=UPI00063BE8B7|nr:YetF domain-containing protein [Hoeflea sp. IMCC20628]AKH99017.1 putative membrane protein [Hoeflea sp. IMCC20628]